MGFYRTNVSIASVIVTNIVWKKFKASFGTIYVVHEISKISTSSQRQEQKYMDQNPLYFYSYTLLLSCTRSKIDFESHHVSTFSRFSIEK